MAIHSNPSTLLTVDGPRGVYACPEGVSGDLSAVSSQSLTAALFHLADLWSATEWALGDLVVEMLRRARDGHPLPEAAWANLHQATSAKAATVALAFPFARRRADLTWSHHELVAAMPEAHQDRLLNTAAVEGLSVRALRAIITQEAEDARPQLGGMPVARWKPPQRLAVQVGELLAVHPEAAGDVEAALADVVRRYSEEGA